jgi:hypothetical protein
MGVLVRRIVCINIYTHIQVARYTFSAAEEMGPKREQASAGVRGKVL